MHIFRLCSKQYRTLDGEGVRLFGGRWNSIHIPLVYIPSYIIQTEFNVLINPNHPDMNAVKVIDTSPFTLDSRLLN